MSDQPEALRLADWLDGSSNGPLDVRHKAAAELRLLYEANEAFAKRQTWWNDRMVELEAALRQAVGALEFNQARWQGKDEAVTAAKQALGES